MTPPPDSFTSLTLCCTVFCYCLHALTSKKSKVVVCYYGPSIFRPGALRRAHMLNFTFCPVTHWEVNESLLVLWLKHRNPFSRREWRFKPRTSHWTPSLAVGAGAGLTSGGLMLNTSAIFAYSSLTLEKPSILPVGLPCASCVWNTSFGRRLAGGGGRPAPFTADLLGLPAPACPPWTSSFSTKCSFVDLFFFLHGPSGMSALVRFVFRR